MAGEENGKWLLTGMELMKNILKLDRDYVMVRSSENTKSHCTTHFERLGIGYVSCISVTHIKGEKHTKEKAT
jgi:hypothetical protein